MKKYIELDSFKTRMYDETFINDNPTMQRWDSGCWIRYKLFETVLADQPIIEIPNIIRCKDCLEYMTDWHSTAGENVHYCAMIDGFMNPEDFCSRATKKESEVNK